MKNIFMECGFVSLSKHGEKICGDYYTMVKKEDTTTIVLSDGLGSGIKANILATLTSKILSTMMAGNMSIEDSVYTVAKTLPVCKVRNLAYSTFTIFQLVHYNNNAYLAQFDNPSVILIREGKNFPYCSTCKIIGEKEIYESNIQLQVYDMIILLTDGITSAGLGRVTTNGWPRDEIIKYIELWYTPNMSPQRMASAIADACLDLSLGTPQDDSTVAVFKIRKRQVVNLIIGPPEKKEEDNIILKLFFSKAGKKIVCGGSTSKMVSNYLNKPIKAATSSQDEEIPAIASIEGVDLVTEGVITLGRVVELGRKYLENSKISLDLENKTDGASLLAKLLFEEATDVNFFIGKAINPGNEIDGMKISASVKMSFIKEIKVILIEMDKKVKVSLC
ncbi:serine/threonine-protein phosphatase [Clostridium sp. FP2]|uniref:SpoIIE family protein phosphatase n=1 Tax=Clostridium sp. FP2 TaxID=2724481 RepID=UPI0013E996D0|nr:SpoIIE family protein phosphatase [Clostridium sp. FP2]MBZ9623338.1 serine/threonine-protein phosphatase [Clostridium sp. FP2]